MNPTQIHLCMYTSSHTHSDTDTHPLSSNPHPMEAEGLNCGKVSIFKLDILVISKGSDIVIYGIHEYQAVVFPSCLFPPSSSAQ